MDIALVAMVDGEDTAKNTVGQYCGSFMKFPYTVNIPGVYAYSAEHKGTDIVPSGAVATDKAIEMDLTTLPIGGTLTTALRLGGGWAITRGGWNRFECKITDSDGVSKTITILASDKVKDIESGTLSALSSYKYGENMGLGGNLFDRIAIDLTGFEGKTLTLEVYGISNFGMAYKLANIKNVTVAGLDNVFTAQDFYIAHKTTTNTAYTSELLTEDGVTFFRATATAAGNGRITLNAGTKTVENFGKSYILVYRNSSANSGQKFQLYITAASGASGTMIPAIVKENTDEWKVAILNYSHTLDMSMGAKQINVDLFYNNGLAGDMIDIALFAGVENEEEAWAIFEETLGDKIGLPYASNIAGVTVNGTAYKDASVLPGDQKAVGAPVVIDLDGITFDTNSNLASFFKLGAGYSVTRSGWDYFNCKITSEGGKAMTYRISEGVDLVEGDTLTALKTEFASYGSDIAIGGNLFSPLTIDLSGFGGEKVTVEIIGVSNYGVEYCIASIVNVTVPGTAAYNKVDDFVSFVDYTKTNNRRIVDIEDGTTYGVSFTVPTGEQVNTLRVNLTNNNSMDACSINVSIYSFTGNYADTVISAPMYSETFTSVIKSADIDTKLASGNYLAVVKYVSADGDVLSTVVTDNAWSSNTLPSEYAKYNIVSYKNGDVNASEVLYGGILVETVGAVAPADDVISATFSDTTAKVIVIAGQSNAAGTTKSSYLQQNISAEDYAKYENGFSNVKIYYTCGTGSSGVSHTNVTEEFVEVKPGQGAYSWLFGPELELAAYLSENYPDEQFYIIKYAIGGTAMDIQWNATQSGKRQCLDELEAKIDSGLGLLEAAGLDPEILAFIWMQGEGDANPASRTAPYYGYQKALIAELRERYADYSVEGDIPFIDTEINNEGFWAASYMINDAKNEIARESARNYIIDPNYYGVTALHENNDLAHYDSTSMLLLGRLYAQKICEIYDFSTQ